MKKFLTFSLFAALALALLFAVAPVIDTGPPDLNNTDNNKIYALNQMSDLTISTATGSVNGGPNLQILATATPSLESTFLNNCVTLTTRPDSATFHGANYNESPPTKSLWIIAPVIANRPGYPLRT